jgi:hypothetical protein
MAKTQNLSLNPTKISGTCGRLMCCLKYEQDAYEDLLKNTPKEESFVDTPDGRGTVTEVSLLRQRVKVRLESDPDTIAQFRVDEIAVWRNGKPKKNEEPVPADWAPISGGGRKRRRLEPVEQTPALDPIRFRYSQEAVVEEPPVEELPQSEQAEEKQSGRRSRRHRGNRQKNRQEEVQQLQQSPEEAPKPKQEKQKQKPAKAEKPKATEPAAEAAPAEAGEKKPGGHRNHHRRHYRKPKAPKAE